MGRKRHATIKIHIEIRTRGSSYAKMRESPLVRVTVGYESCFRSCGFLCLSSYQLGRGLLTDLVRCVRELLKMKPSLSISSPDDSSHSPPKLDPLVRSKRTFGSHLAPSVALGLISGTTRSRSIGLLSQFILYNGYYQ